MNDREQWLFEDDPNDFQLVPEVIQGESWEQKQQKRLAAIEKNAALQSPDLFPEEGEKLPVLSKHYNSWD